METKTLGEVIRMMVESALKKDELSCSARVNDIINMVKGDQNGIPFEERTISLPNLKSSYIYNTTSRIGELVERGLKAKHTIIQDDFGDDILTIKLIKGTYSAGARKKSDNQAAAKAVEDFKARVMRLMPDISHLDGDEVILAAKVIKAMKDIIEEMK